MYTKILGEILKSMNRLGLCCMWDDKRTHSIRTLTLKRFRTLGPGGPQALGEVILHNVKSVRKMIELCRQRGWNYRIPQTIFPLVSIPNFGVTVEDLPQWPEIQAEFSAITREKCGVRLSMHPSAFCIPGSETPSTVTAAISELEMSSKVLDLCGASLGYESPINIHMGCSTRGLEATMSRFTDSLGRMSGRVRFRLVLENDDKGPWTTHAIYQHGWRGPITFDFHHHACNPGTWSEYQAFSLALASWGNVCPLFHYSEPDSPSNRRAHAMMPTRRANDYQCGFDLDIELKGKSRAVEAYENLK